MAKLKYPKGRRPEDEEEDDIPLSTNPSPEEARDTGLRGSLWHTLKSAFNMAATVAAGAVASCALKTICASCLVTFGAGPVATALLAGAAGGLLYGMGKRLFFPPKTDKRGALARMFNVKSMLLDMGLGAVGGAICYNLGGWPDGVTAGPEPGDMGPVEPDTGDVAGPGGPEPADTGPGVAENFLDDLYANRHEEWREGIEALNCYIEAHPEIDDPRFFDLASQALDQHNPMAMRELASAINYGHINSMPGLDLPAGECASKEMYEAAMAFENKAAMYEYAIEARIDGDNAGAESLMQYVFEHTNDYDDAIDMNDQAECVLDHWDRGVSINSCGPRIY